MSDEIITKEKAIVDLLGKAANELKEINADDVFDVTITHSSRLLTIDVKYKRPCEFVGYQDIKPHPK